MSMRNALAALTLTFTLFLAQSAAGATNGLDEQFGSGGIVLLGPTPVSGLTLDQIYPLAIRADGQIVVGGRTFDSTHVAWLAAIGRLNADGSWDTSFADHGLFVLPYGTASAPNGGVIHEVMVLSDHSIVAAGASVTASSSPYFDSCTLLVKLNSAGVLSSTFAPDQSGSFCYDFAPNTNNYKYPVHSEGLVSGSGDSFYLTTPATNLDHGVVAHFDTNGALISGYGNSGVADLPVGTRANLLELTSNQEILAVGASNSSTEIAVARLDVAGALVSGYGTNGVTNFDQQASGGMVYPLQAVLDAQQRLLIADYDGNFVNNLPYCFARLTDSGALDSTFNGNGQQPGYPGFAIPAISSGTDNDTVVGVQPLPDAHLFAVGDVGHAGNLTADIALLRLNEDSSYDAGFGDAGHPGWSSINVYGTSASSSFARSLAIDAASRVFVTIAINDGAGHACPGVMRVVSDRLFNGQFDPPPAFPTCP